MSNKVNQSEGKINFKTIESKWRANWQELDLYKTGDDPNKPNVYILDYFPYPSGDGLSVGHCRNYVPTCVSARFHRMKGYNVLHPMGWDAFGLPAENYAVEHGIHPRESSEQFCATYRRQMKLVECSYDWSREFSSTDPDYYRWTQWFFLLLYRRGLAYRAKGSQWFCPQCSTILANEQVEDGRCWRCDTVVTRKELEQWYFKITAYADRLLDDLATIEWPESIKASQRNWIGRSEGVEVIFSISAAEGCDGGGEEIAVFTTRPDTLYGVTFLALAPEHPLVAHICTDEQKAAVEQYVQRAQRQTDTDRTSTTKEKIGIFSGANAVNPLTREPIPIWVADYVLPGYGTGAIMGVPGHDQRDRQFADKNGLPVVTVVHPGDGEEVSCFEDRGILVNSGPYTGQDSAVATEGISDELETNRVGKRSISYKMRDWLISRQRYWGAPIPIIHCPTCGIVPVPEEELPVCLPEISDFKPSGDGRSPLARVAEWVNTSCPSCGGPAQRETDTMDGFACSSWYFLRFTSPHYQDGPFDPQAMRNWMPVDSYVGGAEHAVMHLLYSRFWTKVMFDAGLVPFSEPFASLRNQGMLLSAIDGQKMSKSKHNVVTPDEIVVEYGADALRAYILFLGPFDAEVTWDKRGIIGITRFLNRFWRLAKSSPQNTNRFSEAQMRHFERRRHQIIERVTRDMEAFRFNTAVAALMTYLNYLVESKDDDVEPEQWRSAIKTMTLLLSPIAPFITEEVWQNVLGDQDSVHIQPWPQYDSALAQEEQVTVIVQVNGRVRDRLQVEVGTERKTLCDQALASASIQRHVNGKTIRNMVIVPDQLVNIVI